MSWCHETANYQLQTREPRPSPHDQLRRDGLLRKRCAALVATAPDNEGATVQPGIGRKVAEGSILGQAKLAGLVRANRPDLSSAATRNIVEIGAGLALSGYSRFTVA